MHHFGGRSCIGRIDSYRQSLQQQRNLSPCRFPIHSSSMKATRARWCTLFPWLFRTIEMSSPKDVSSGTKMVELRGLGDAARYERAGMSYTSLRDIIAAQKRKPTRTTEVDDVGLRVNNNCPRTPKSRLLEKAALAWLQPTVCDRSLQQRNFFLRYWLKYTKPTTPPLALRSPSANLSSCKLHLPFLKCFDMSPSAESLREPKTFPLLCH